MLSAGNASPDGGTQPQSFFVVREEPAQSCDQLLRRSEVHDRVAVFTENLPVLFAVLSQRAGANGGNLESPHRAAIAVCLAYETKGDFCASYCLPQRCRSGMASCRLPGN